MFKRFTYVRWLWAAVIITPFILLLDAIFPILKPAEIAMASSRFKALGILRWEDGKDHAIPQDFADMLGWHDISALVLKAWNEVPEQDKKHTIILCDNYGQAGAINFYNRGKTPAAVATEADYVFWFPKLDSISYVIKVGHEPDSVSRQFIGQVATVGGLSDTLCREQQWGTHVYLLSGIAAGLPKYFLPRLQQIQRSYMPY